VSALKLAQDLPNSAYQGENPPKFSFLKSNPLIDALRAQVSLTTNLLSDTQVPLCQINAPSRPIRP